MSEETFLTLNEVMEITTVGRSTLYSWMPKGLFPRPVNLGPRKVAWLQSDIDDWMEARIGTSFNKKVFDDD